MKVRKFFERSFLLVGVLAIDVWIWSHAGAVIYQSWQDRKLDQQIDANSEQTSSAGESSAGKVAASLKKETRANGPVGRLIIPRLKLRAVINEGTGEDTLSLALGHIPSTALPGETGNMAIAGHRDTIFRALRDIRKNDLIVLETRGAKYAYRVEGMQIVKPSQVSVLRPGRSRELTLVTCYPFRYIGSAPDRFIVRARQVASKQKVI
jgi:sortase A